LYKNLDISFLHFVTMHVFDRRTNRQRDRLTPLVASPRWHSVQHGKNLLFHFKQIACFGLFVLLSIVRSVYWWCAVS